MKRQRPSLDTSFGSPSLQRAPQASLNANRTRANSAASQSSSAFATPPEGSSPNAQSGIGADSNIQGAPGPSRAVNATPSYTSTHNRTASAGSPPLFEFVRAKYDYTPDHPSGLPFYAGQIIRVHYKDQSGWWDGECGNVRGWFPSNYLLENSSRFVRATPQASRRNVAKLSRNASIDVVTTADLQMVQGRSMSSLAGRTPTTSNSTSEVTTPTQPPYSDRRRPSLATANEADELRTEVDQRQIGVAGRHPAVTGTGRPPISRSNSSQNVLDYSLMSSRAQAQPYSQSHSRYPSHSAVSTYGGYQDSAPNPQPSQQDWANLSFEDLVALQKYLAYPSPLSSRRHPAPSSPFEPDVIKLLLQQDSSVTDKIIGEETAQVQYLNVTHRALWVIENAAIATIQPTPAPNMESSGSSGSSTNHQPGTVSVELRLSISNQSYEGALAARDHLAPAMACVIGTVRSVLSSSGCLARESINLHSFPMLLNHRKVVLGELARLVSQTKRVGSRDDEFADPLSPVADDTGRRGSLVTGNRNSGSDLGLEADSDVEIKRELERSQAVYDAVRRFIVAAIECRIHVEQPPYGVRGLFGLEEDEMEGYSGESDGLTGEGSWEEDHGFRFHVATNSQNNNSGSAEESGPSTSEHTSSLTLVRSSKYAIRARRFTNGRPGHLRARAGSHGSGASGYASGSGSGSAGSRNSGGSVSKATPLDSIQQRFEYKRPHAATIVGRGEAGTESKAVSGAEPRAASAVAAAAAMRAAKSLGDLRAKYKRNGAGEKPVPPLVSEDAALNPSVKAARRGKVIHGRSTKPNAAAAVSPIREHGGPSPRANKSSISSVSSADSSSTHSSSPTNSSPPGSPGLPAGPCTLAQVLQALRATQDRILHGTAAFIGAAQYHSRSSHPASKGYIVSLTREIVDFVRRLLMIAEAVISHPTVQVNRAREVEMAGVYKARLYVEMNKVVDTVRDLTAIRNDDSDVGSSVEQEDGDDEEKRVVLKSAHLTNKCAADLVLALKLCLSLRSSGATSDGQEGQTNELVIVIPEEAAKLTQQEYEQSATESYDLSSPSDKDVSTLSTPITSPLQGNDNTPRPAPQSDQSDKEDAASANPAVNRARSQTTRDNRRYSINGSGLHKKAASMIGMNAAYRSSGLRDLHQISEREESRGLQKLSSKTSEEIAAYMEAEEERTAELKQEHHPLLMSEQEYSDAQDDLEPEEGAENALLDFGGSRMVLEDEPVVVAPPKTMRRSVDQNQVRLSLERGLIKRPSLDLEEPTTPLDGTEEVIGLEEDEKEDIDQDIPPPTPEKELPLAPTLVSSSRPVSALPPKPANTDGFIVSHNGDIVLNSDGVVVGATLGALVERVTPSDVFGDQKLASYFLLTFRLFTTPSELVDAIINRFKNPITIAPAADPAPMSSSASLAEPPRGQSADIVHLRLINFIKEWVQRHWYPVRDAEALPKLIALFRDLAGGLYPKVAGPAKRLLPELEKMNQNMNAPSSGPSFDSVRARMDRARSAIRLRDQNQAMPLSALSNPLTPTTPISASSPGELPRPELAKSLLNQLRTRQYLNVSILEFSPIEMARQLTLLESRLYQELPPEEVLETGKGSKNTPHINEIINLSTAITGWVTDFILKEGLDIKRRVAYIKFFLKVGKECLALNNYSTPRSMMAALESTPISRLRAVWAGVSQKHMVVFNEMRHLCEHTRNSAYYRERLRSTPPPAIPFLGLVLTDVTFTREGNGALRPCPTNPGKMLINFNRYNRLAKILGDMIRLQQPYSLKEIPEVQQYLNFTLDATRFTRDADVLHSQSLLIEPKADDDSKKGSDLFGWNFGSVRGNPP